MEKSSQKNEEIKVEYVPISIEEKQHQIDRSFDLLFEAVLKDYQPKIKK